jgi:hypothetical protein
MKRILAVIMLLCLVASSAYGIGIDGTWSAKMKGPDGDMELTLLFKLVDGRLSGVV